MDGGVTQKVGLGITAEVLVAQLCPTLCNPMDYSPPGSSVHRILQARILEWVAMPSSKGIFLTQGFNLGLLHCRQTLSSGPARKLLLQLKRAQKFCNHQTTHLIDKNTERGLRRKEAARSVGLAFHQQSLPSPPLSASSSPSFFCWGEEGSGKQNFSPSASLLLRFSFHQALVWRAAGRGQPPQGLFQSETDVAGNRGSCPFSGITAWAKSRRVESFVSGLPLTQHTWGHQGVRFGDRRLYISRLQSKEKTWIKKMESRLRSLSGCRKPS
ncbi:unnamed protein product [Rangifer tarandus platyrhynchus]|uniref:Uncharacterized protein n=1 Tax=Rangifer tarandus platyrhynchus TaxID=3082113 RepID=A0AC59Y636_RANTA